VKSAILGLAAAFAAAVAVAGQARVWAQDGPSSAPSSKEDEAVARCAASTPAHRDAEDALRALNQRIEGLAASASPAEALEDLHGLLRMECFRLAAAENPRLPETDSSPSLKEWWDEDRGGGFNWLASYLSLPELGFLQDPLLHVILPPDVRKTLDLTTDPTHPLRSLLCPRRDDSSCGASTRGWKRRANEHFEGYPAWEAKFMATSEDDEAVPPSAESISRTCEAGVSSLPDARRYQDWRICVEQDRPKRVALPLGEFQAPRAGWVIVNGRRGHHEFCDTTSAFDLATGSVFMHERCSSLVLKWDAEAYGAVHKPVRTEKVRRGTVMVESLREAFWMMLLRGETEEVQVASLYVPLPAGFTPRVTPPLKWTDGPVTTWTNTAQTYLAWRWVRRADTSLVGNLIWPNSADAAEDHAASLLAIAEESLVDECPAARPVAPGALRASKTSRVDDAFDERFAYERLADLDSDYRESFAKWSAMPACGRAPANK
jgi:hypothetical protein